MPRRIPRYQNHIHPKFNLDSPVNVTEFRAIVYKLKLQVWYTINQKKRWNNTICTFNATSKTLCVHERYAFCDCI